jgi:hypothetical protein
MEASAAMSQEEREEVKVMGRELARKAKSMGGDCARPSSLTITPDFTGRLIL